jgi:hypothetical protein
VDHAHLIQPCHLPYSVERIAQSCLTLCSDPGSSSRVPLSQPPFLNQLRGARRTMTVVWGFSGNMGLSNFPLPHIPGVSPRGSQGGLPRPILGPVEGSPGSRARCFHTCSRSLTEQGLNVSRDNRESTLFLNKLKDLFPSIPTPLRRHSK